MTTLVSRLRPELQPLPPRMQLLRVDERGFPVPWFVQWVTGEMPNLEVVPPSTPGARPEFRLMDQQKWMLAVRDGRCWVCGGTLGTFKTFVLGPMCGLNRTTAEPPCHRECAQWSARNCPFLTRPQMVRRDNDGLMAHTIANVAGEMIVRNPGVTLLWTTKGFTVWRDEKGAPLITVGEPTAIEWIAEGRRATRAEVEASVTSGYPRLEQMAIDQDAVEGIGAVAELARRRQVLEGLYPHW